MKYLIAILMLCAACQADAWKVLGKRSELTWTGSGATRVASFAQGGGPVYVIGATTNSYGFENWPGATTASRGTNEYYNGWSVLTNAFITTAVTNFTANSIRFPSPAGTNDQQVILPTPTNGIYALSFWIRGLTSATNYMVVDKFVDGSWIEVVVLQLDKTATTAYYPTNIILQLTGTPTIRMRPYEPLASSRFFDDFSWTSYTVTP